MLKKSNDGISHHTRGEIYSLLEKNRLKASSAAAPLHVEGSIEEQSEDDVGHKEASGAPLAWLTRMRGVRFTRRVYQRIVMPKIVDIYDQLQTANVGLGQSYAGRILIRAAWMICWSLVKTLFHTLKESLLDLLDRIFGV